MNLTLKMVDFAPKMTWFCTENDEFCTEINEFTDGILSHLQGQIDQGTVSSYFMRNIMNCCAKNDVFYAKNEGFTLI